MKYFLSFLFSSIFMMGLQIEYSISGGMNSERFELFRERYNLNTFIETGTCMGSTTAVASPFFKDVYTIELSEQLFNLATAELVEFSNVQTIWGSSEEEIQKILDKEGGHSTLIFLDAHYSEWITVKGKNDPPVMDELFVIADYVQDDTVIILDDVRCFGFDLTAKSTDYPHLRDIKEYVESNFKPGFRFCIIGDQAIFYNPDFYNDQISPGVELFTALYLAKDKTEFIELSEGISTVCTESEKSEIMRMANATYPSAVLCYVAFVIQKDMGDVAAAEKYLKLAYKLGLK